MPDRPSLVEVPLPDLSRLDASVQTQISTQHAAALRTRDRPGVGDAEVGAAFGSLGMLMHAAEYLDAAEPAYRNAAALTPSDPRWPYFLGLVGRARGRLPEAVDWFSRALALSPDDVPALVWLGRTYLDLGQSDLAERRFQHARTVAPKAVAVLAGLAQVALAAQDFARAAALLEEALTIDPRADSLHSPLASAYRGLGRTADAEAHLRRWRNIELPLSDPRREELNAVLESGLSYDLRGARALAGGDYRAAGDFFRRGVALTDGATQLGRSLRHKLATTHALTGDTAAAIAGFEEVTRLAPEEGLDDPAAKAHYSLGVIKASSGQGPEAIAHFTRAVAFNPAYLEARMALGDALRAAGRDETALAQYAEIVRLNPMAADARLGHAVALVRLRRYAAARDWLTAGVAAQPDRPELRHMLARVLATAPEDRVRDGARALAIVKELLGSFKTPYVGETLAMALAELGRFDEAVAVQRNLVTSAQQGATAADVRRTTANLSRYERRQPCRTPWPDDDPIFHPVPRPAS
jgi:tetratricopeptide (TPR) repeat protein